MAKFSSSSSSYKIIVDCELVVSIQVKTSHDYVSDILLYKKEKENLISLQKNRISKLNLEEWIVQNTQSLSYL